MSTVDPERAWLRRTLAPLADRGAKAARNASGEFAGVQGAGKAPVEILAPIGDLLDWGLSMARGKPQWRVSTPLPWREEVERFFTALENFDRYLASTEPLETPAPKLFQGPIADALTHVGQIARLRRLAGAPIQGENYFVAAITAGRVGPDQAPPQQEF
ncbi:MAG TPA: hypothetical protein VEK33_20990 [Terriglobales bacterium]|nr:hypothetical protein [Terriglobales bacterium]